MELITGHSAGCPSTMALPAPAGTRRVRIRCQLAGGHDGFHAAVGRDRVRRIWPRDDGDPYNRTARSAASAQD